MPPKQQRRDHDSLLNRIQAVENQTKAEIQQINNPMGPQGNGGDLEPELSLSQLEEHPIKKMINEQSIIEATVQHMLLKVMLGQLENLGFFLLHQVLGQLMP